MPTPQTARPKANTRRRYRVTKHAVRSLSNVRLSEDAYGDLCVAANRRGLTNAAYVRMVLLDQIDRERAVGHLPASPITPAGVPRPVVGVAPDFAPAPAPAPAQAPPLAPVRYGAAR